MNPADPNEATRDRIFPTLTGVGVMIALSIEAVLSPLQVIPFPLLAVVFSIPLATLRVRAGRVIWLGDRHVSVAFASVLASYLPFVLMFALIPGASGTVTTFSFPPRPDATLTAAFIGLEGGISMWFALHLQWWADREPPGIRRERSWRNPRTWGLNGKAGGTLALAGLAGFVWFMLRFRALPFAGPQGLLALFGRLEMGAVALIGLGGILAEGVVGLLRRK
ncbi:MAG TPA: hypothetical protein VJ400_07895 [Thermoplasmata archaeon]|nr:hypothetical protein [Thermoplasmata archaeon]